MLNIKQFVFNPFDENTYVAFDPATREAVIIDPGMCNAAECKRVEDFIAEKKLTVKAVALTHMHLDHCFGANAMHKRYGAPVAASPADAELGASIAAQAARFGLHVPDSEAVVADRALVDGDSIDVGHEVLKVIAVPGHSRGGLSLYCAEGNVVFTGDSLFRRSIGRTDLPGGNARQLVASVRNKLLTLPDSTLVLPGHGPSTTIGEERLGNPYII